MDKKLIENLNNKQHNYIAPFLWLHNEDDGLIVNEIERIHQCGIRSVCLESRTHEEFCRDDWWSDIGLIFETCKKLNMNVWILDDKHFPSGYANGIFEDKYKHLQAFGITEEHIDVPGPVKDGCAMASCYLKDNQDEMVGIYALKHIPNSDKYCDVIDITDGYYKDMVYFDLPEGMWRIVFVIKTKRGRREKQIPYCDMLSSKAVDLFVEEVYQAHYDRFSQYFGNTFLGFFSDEPSFLNNTMLGFSPDMGVNFAHYPWNDKLKEMIDVKYISGLWFDVENHSDKIRYSYMNTITDEYKRNFGDKIGNWCREHHVMYIGHVIEDNNIHAKTGNGAGHYFRALNGQDMSGIDVVLNQIVPGLTECSNAGPVSYKHMNNEFFHYYLAKLGSSLAHIDPKKKGRSMCEIFGAYGWAEGTKIMKYLADHMLVRGINYFVPHAFSPKPNDTDCPPNFYDNGDNPQFPYFKYIMGYMNRMCDMFNDGVHISTCAILYDAENQWINKDFVPLEKIAKKLYDSMYDYDIIPVDYLDKIVDSSLNGEKYNVLFVPYSDSIPKDIIHKLRSADIKVVFVSYDEEDTEFENVTLNNLIGYMKDNGYCDVSSCYDGIYLRYYHYSRDNTHIYMLNNEDINNSISTKIKLSSFNGGQYVEYDVFDNVAVIKEADDEIQVDLLPYNSRLIIFGDVDMENIPQYYKENISKEKIINPVFKISIAEKNSTEFKPYKTTEKLFNLTGKNELPEFSGHIKYETVFDGESGIQSIDLGRVGETAELYINGEYVGVKLYPPYRFNISEFVRDGKNEMTVIVSNHNGFLKKDMFSKYLLFEPSGLLGDIKII